MTARIVRLGISIGLTVGTFGLLALPAFSAAGSASKRESQPSQTVAKQQTTAAQQSAGERKFNQNCSRCHKAPEGFSPSISGTVLKHMRVRASLSQQDERDILSFLNP